MVLVSISGCTSISYVIQGGLGQLAIYNKEKTLKEALEDPYLAETTKEQLRWIPEIKKDIHEVMGLEATSNYGTFVDLKRKYVVWSITVAEPYLLKQKEWSFPIVGSFPYLGFFSEDTAKSWAKDYERDGKDVFVRGVSAYSSLGYFRDPVLSSMLSGKKQDLVNLLYHETLHTHFYMKNEGTFNEQVASFFGDYGEKGWIERNYGKQSAELREWEMERMDRRRFGVRLRHFSEDLKKLYMESQDLTEDQKRATKAAKFSEFQDLLAKEPWGTSLYKSSSSWITNNAALMAFLTYEDDQDVFDLLYHRCGESLAAVYAALKEFSRIYPLEVMNAGEEKTPQRVLEKILNEIKVVSGVASSFRAVASDGDCVQEIKKVRPI